MMGMCDVNVCIWRRARLSEGETPLNSMPNVVNLLLAQSRLSVRTGSKLNTVTCVGA